MGSSAVEASPRGDDDAWVPEPLAPGALGYEPGAGDDGPDEPGLFDELPPLPLAGPLADTLTAARAALDQAVTSAGYLASVGREQRLEALQRVAECRVVADAVLLRLTSSFTREDVQALGATGLVDLLVRHTGAAPARAKTETVLAAALTAPVRGLPTGWADPDGNGSDVTREGEDVPFDLDAEEATGAADPGAEAPADAGSSAVALGRLGAVHAEGRVSTDVASLATRTVASLPAAVRRSHGGAADEVLARLLPGLSHEQARTVCSTLAHRLDPDRADRGYDPDELDRRYLNLSLHDDGWGDVRGRLDPETAAELKAFLDARSKPAATVRVPLAPDQLDPDQADQADQPDQPDRPDDSPGNDGGRASGGVTVRDTRTPGQRRADALAEGIRSALADAGTRGGEPARVVVTTTDDQLAGVPGAGQALCETTNRHLSSAQLARVACSGALQAVRLSCDGADAAVLALGRSVRLFTASQRRAMLARDGGCVIPGCTAPPAMLEAHHTTDWQHGGCTDVDHGVLLCTRHHVLVTVGVWEVAMVAGVPQVRPPRSVDPLRRWVRNPRRLLRDRVARAADRVVEQLLLDPSGGWADDPPREPAPAPDIPSPRSTSDC